MTSRAFELVCDPRPRIWPCFPDARVFQRFYLELLDRLPDHVQAATEMGRYRPR